MTGPNFVYVSYIRTTPEKLWQALTQSAFTRQYWFGHAVESDWKPGSAIRFFAAGKCDVQGEVLASDPYRRLAYSWRVDFDEALRNEEPSRVSFDLEPVGPEVKLTVIHDQFGAGSKVYPGISNGWPMVLASLKSLLETGEPLAATSEAALCAARQRSLDLARATAA
ncbi:MAG TPA: SRPBCC family protein [Pseudolabrys sp.]|nr:SRPBCC family protein [Pseudolabrys sp.]